MGHFGSVSHFKESKQKSIKFRKCKMGVVKLRILSKDRLETKREFKFDLQKRSNST